MHNARLWIVNIDDATIAKFHSAFKWAFIWSHYVLNGWTCDERFFKIIIMSVRSFVCLFILYFISFSTYLNFFQMYFICQFVAFFKFLVLCHMSCYENYRQSCAVKIEHNTVFDVWILDILYSFIDDTMCCQDDWIYFLPHRDVIEGFQIFDFFICI